MTTTVELAQAGSVLACASEPGDAVCSDCAEAAPFLASAMTNLVTERDDLQAQVDGMRAEGCATVAALSSIFGLVTPQGMDVTEREQQVADIAADVIVTAKSCTHKAELEKLRDAQT